MLSIAHRGYSSLYDDNNIVSFQKAIEHHFDIIEIDIQLNNENEIVIFHESSINNKLIKYLNNKETQEYKLVLFKDFFKNIDLPKNMKLLLDLKGYDDELAIILYDFLINNKINLHQIIIGSFNLDYLKYINKQLFKIPLGYITANNDFMIKSSLYNQIKYIIVDITMISKIKINKLKQQNKIVFAYTCHNECELELFQNKQLDGIISNVKIN
jgi:glycerophosphoryl diester phosphodiesterase